MKNQERMILPKQSNPFLKNRTVLYLHVCYCFSGVYLANGMDFIFSSPSANLQVISQYNYPIYYIKHFNFPGAAIRGPASADHPLFFGPVHVTTAPMRMHSTIAHPCFIITARTSDFSTKITLKNSICNLRLSTRNKRKNLHG